MLTDAGWPCVHVSGDAPGVDDATPPRERAGVLADRLLEGLGSETGTALLFPSPDLPVVELLEILGQRAPDLRIYGASTSGPVSSGALEARGLSAIRLPDDRLTVASLSFDADQGTENWPEIATRLHGLERELGLHRLLQPAREGFLMLFSAGLLAIEEYVVSRLHVALPDLPLVGGTASDGLSFARTFVIDDGELRENHNLILMARSTRPFETFQHHHYMPTGQRVVVTKTGVHPRAVAELDGRPASDVYAEILGLSRQELSVPAVSSAPFGVRVRDHWYIRSVYQVDDETLVFACAVENGTVLTLMEPGDIIGRLRSHIERLSARALSGVVLFNCLGRYLELEQTGQLPAAAAATEGLPVAGMNTYGEQYMGLHLNHTLTGIAFFDEERAGAEVDRG